MKKVLLWFLYVILTGIVLMFLFSKTVIDFVESLFQCLNDTFDSFNVFE